MTAASNEPRRILIVASVDDHIAAFHLPYVRRLVDDGWDVAIATSGGQAFEGIRRRFTVPFSRSPWKLTNVSAFRQLRHILNSGDFDVVHCHTPVASIITRLAARRARRKGLSVIYTAHGFHFYRGAPRINWMVFFPIEFACSRWTDLIITINGEDFRRARRFFRCRVEYTPGIGFDPDSFKPGTLDREILRASLGVTTSDILVLCVAEVSRRKRQLWIVKAVDELFRQDVRLHLAFAGRDSLHGRLSEAAARFPWADRVHVLGKRDDIPALLQASDILVSASSQEGLPVNIMEAMASGTPVIASAVRGNSDLVHHEESGFTFDQNDAAALRESIRSLTSSPAVRAKFSRAGMDIVQSCRFEIVWGRYQNLLLDVLAMRRGA